MRKFILVLSSFCAILSANGRVCFSEEPQWGTIKGQVRLLDHAPMLSPLSLSRPVCGVLEIPDEKLVVDPSSKGIANLVVYLRKKPADVHPSLLKSKDETITISLGEARFVPHVALIRTDQKVQILSVDPCVHSVSAIFRKNFDFDVVLQPNDRNGMIVGPFEVSESIPTKLSSNVYPWMSGYWMILNHPYAAVTDGEGNFEIPNLPVGKHEFVIWQESAGYLNKSYRVTVAEGLNELPPVEFSLQEILK